MAFNNHFGKHTYIGKRVQFRPDLDTTKYITNNESNVQPTIQSQQKQKKPSKMENIKKKWKNFLSIFTFKKNKKTKVNRQKLKKK